MAIVFCIYTLYAQQIIYGDYEQINATLKTSANNSEKSSEANRLAYYSFDQTIPNTFTSDNNTLVVCRLVQYGADTNVVCSTDKPKKGWGTMVSGDENDFFYQENIHNAGVKITSMVFTDPKSGWAVGEMETSSVVRAVVFHTQNGGLTWSLQFMSGTSMKLYSAGFTDSKNGWAIGERTIGNSNFEIVLVTINGGELWEEKSLAYFNNPNSN